MTFQGLDYFEDQSVFDPGSDTGFLITSHVECIECRVVHACSSHLPNNHHTHRDNAVLNKCGASPGLLFHAGFSIHSIN